MANGFSSESALNRFLNETLPRFYQNQVEIEESARRYDQTRQDALDEIQRTQANFEQTRQDNLNFQNRQLAQH